MKGFTGLLLLLAASTAHGQEGPSYDDIANNMDNYRNEAQRASSSLGNRIAGFFHGPYPLRNASICADLGSAFRHTIDMRVKDGIWVITAMDMDGQKPAGETRHYRYAAAQIFYGAISEAKEANKALDKCIVDNN